MLALGLKAIRNQEPSFQPKSLSQLAKIIYYDYLAKANIDFQLEPALLEEINQLATSQPRTKITLDDLIQSKDSSNA
jgi:hypothetical protein